MRPEPPARALFGASVAWHRTGTLDERRDFARSAAILVAAMLVALALHLAAPMYSYFGEPDAVIFAVDAQLAIKGGIRSVATSEYRYFTSPAWIWLVEQIVRRGTGDVASVGAALNGINLAVAVLIVVPVYLVGRRLVGPPAAAIASVLVSFVPTFFQGGQYGFPTLVAEFFLLWALWLYDVWLARERPWEARSAWLLAGMCLCLCAAALLKADVYIGAVALWGLLLVRGKLTVPNAVTLCVVGAIPVALLYAVAAALLAHSSSAASYGDTWSHKFPFRPLHELTVAHFLQLAKSMGVLTIPLFVAGVVWLARHRRGRLATTLAVWAALPILFWFFRAGDSARHHFPSSVPIVLGAAVLLAALPVRSVVRVAALGALLVVNYMAFGPDPDTQTTSGRFLASGKLLARTVAAFHRGAREYVSVDAPRKVYIGRWRRIWYVQPEVMALADTVLGYRMVDRFGLTAIDVDFIRHGQRYAWTVAGATNEPPPVVRAAAAAYREAGYRVFTFEFDDSLEHILPPAKYRLVEVGLPRVDGAGALHGQYP
jgi:hypothetical protein